jgi:hypothetical protein
MMQRSDVMYDTALRESIWFMMLHDPSFFISEDHAPSFVFYPHDVSSCIHKICLQSLMQQRDSHASWPSRSCRKLMLNLTLRLLYL